MEMEILSSYDFIPQEEDLFFLTLQSLDIVPAALEDWQYDQYHHQSLSIDDYCLLDGFSFMDSLVPTLTFPSMIDDYHPVPSIFQEAFASSEYSGDDQFRTWNEFTSNIAMDGELNRILDLVAYNCPNIQEESSFEKMLASQIDDQKPNEQKSDTSRKMLTRDELSPYFYMPISQAAKELNMGLTLLKKRCRELGIRRWPQRKLMSMQTLIKNAQEMEKDDGGLVDEEKLRCLEDEKRIIEAIPDVEMRNNTKRLRQACFKAKYKKRKLNEMNLLIDYNASSSSSSSSSSNNSSSTTTNVEDRGGSFGYGVMFEEDAEFLRSLLYDSDQSFSSSDYTLLF